MRIDKFLELRGIDATRLDLVEEFRSSVFGHHSGDLETLINVMRSEHIEGKFFLLMTKPHQEWTLATLSRSHPLTYEVFDAYRFTSIEEAEWAVFCYRWREFFGEQLPGAAIDEALR